MFTDLQLSAIARCCESELMVLRFVETRGAETANQQALITGIRATVLSEIARRKAEAKNEPPVAAAKP